jgi:5-formyltetrahydrofolate cyclo-ligase
MGESEPKSDLRRVIRQSRAARASSHGEETAKSFTEHLTAVSVDSSWSRIASFLPTSTEPPITDFLSKFISQGGWCAVPESGQDGVLLWHALGDDFENHLATDSLGMPFPSTQSLTALENLDAVLVPAAAVDREGNRLGWGKGYYDRFLDSLDSSTLVVAVVFDSDVVDEIPTEPHDKTVDLIVTEEDVYRVRG